MKRLLILACLICGCTDAQSKLKNGAITMPPNATNVRVLDEHWIEFMIDDQFYLFGTFGDGNTSTAVCFPVKG